MKIEPASFGSAQEVSKSLRWKSFGILRRKKDFPNNDITTIIEDKTGKLWFGTRGEALFYDGKTFTVFRNKAVKPLTTLVDKSKIEKAIFGSVQMVFGAMTAVPLLNLTQRGVYAIVEDKKETIWTTGGAILLTLISVQWAFLLYKALLHNESAQNITSEDVTSTSSQMFPFLSSTIAYTPLCVNLVKVLPS